MVSEFGINRSPVQSTREPDQIRKDAAQEIRNYIAHRRKLDEARFFESGGSQLKKYALSGKLRAEADILAWIDEAFGTAED